MDTSDPPGNESQDYALRFEDLTVDDDLPLLDRIVRYCRSGIALQRLVHVKMLAETAETVGTKATLSTLIPILGSLVTDQESVIRQHLASQLLPVSLVAMVRNVGNGQRYTVEDMLENKRLPKIYDSEGYKIVTSIIIGQFLQPLVMDVDVDVRRSASDSLAGLAFHLKKEDVASTIFPIPLRLAKPSKKANHQNQTPDEALTEELRITAANLLAELGGVAENECIPRSIVKEQILPAVLQLCKDPGFRVRRAAAQALPRVLGGTSLQEARTKIVPAFDLLSKDEVYRVRKSTGECLVDMSRSMMILAKTSDGMGINSIRRQSLLPIAEQLLTDANKFVRHGMMQFLGPFLASFYPFVYSALTTILPGTSESDGSNHSGIVAQFFPHASSMVSRLNSSAAATTSAPTPTLTSIETTRKLTMLQELQKTLPAFVRIDRASSVSLKAVVAHRRTDGPDPDDIRAIMGKLLDHFTGLARVNTGDDNTDAEMRVYCAYSYPAVVLLLGPEHWAGRLSDCFKTLLNPNYNQKQPSAASVPPLPVKRCLASSLHTVAHILGPEITAKDIMPIFRDHFLKDTDESVRLNMIRNFPTLVGLLEPPLRNQYMLLWCETIRGEEVLGAMKRSATNPLVLNWRQRDYVSRALPALIVMVDAVFVYTHFWPILKMLLTDTVNLVREDAIWAIPLLLKSFAVENIVDLDGGTTQKVKEAWSDNVCQEVTTWLKETIPRISPSNPKGKVSGKNSTSGNFSQRQLYCRVCSAMALAIRLGDGLSDPDDPVVELESKFKSTLTNSKIAIEEHGPYRKITKGERKHISRLLANDFLPLALEFKDDRVTNVRLSLRKTLLLIPSDIAQSPACREASKCLQEEVDTWESFLGMETSPQPPSPRSVAPPVVVDSMQQQNGNAFTADAAKNSKKRPSRREKKKGAEDNATMAHI